MKDITKKISGFQTGHFLLFLLIISFLAFVLRLSLSFELLQKDIQVSQPSSQTDMATYMELSEKVFRGEFKEPYYYQPFYYAAFLPLVRFLFGSDIKAVLFAQSLISAITVLFAALSGAILFGRRAGILTSLFCAFSATLCLYVPYHLIETMQAFWIALICFCSLRAIKTKNIFWWIPCGIFVSFGILSRGNIWFFVPGLLLAAIYSGRRKSLIHSLIFPAVFMICVFLLQLPFTLHNYKYTGKFSGPSTAAGAVLGLGNTPEAPPGGRNPGFGPGPMEYPETYLDWSASEKNSITEKILDWALSEPLAFLELQFRKFLLFWDHREIPNNIAFEHQGKKSKIFKACIIPSSILISAFIAFIISSALNNIGGKNKFHISSLFSARAVTIYLIISYATSIAVFYNLARFRAPSLPLFAIFAGAFTDKVLRISQNKDKTAKIGKVKPLLAGLLFSCFIVFFSYDLYRSAESKIMLAARPYGTRVVLSDNRILILDNGPITFGGWQMEKIKKGDIIEKTFNTRNLPQKNQSAIFAISIAFAHPGRINLQINGIENTIANNSAGMAEFRFKLPETEEAKIKIRINQVDCDAYWIYDTQRNYSRTLINGKNPGGELVARYYLLEKSLPKSALE